MATFSYVDPRTLSGPALVGVLEHARTKVYDGSRHVAQLLLADPGKDVGFVMAYMRKLAAYYHAVNAEVKRRGAEHGLRMRNVVENEQGQSG